MALGIEKHVSNGVTTLKLTGDLDTATAGQLESTVKEIIAGERPGIVFDMGGISYVSSFGSVSYTHLTLPTILLV